MRLKDCKSSQKHLFCAPIIFFIAIIGNGRQHETDRHFNSPKHKRRCGHIGMTSMSIETIGQLRRAEPVNNKEGNIPLDCKGLLLYQQSANLLWPCVWRAHWYREGKVPSRKSWAESSCRHQIQWPVKVYRLPVKQAEEKASGPGSSNLD